jgi:hypothetical protein
MKYFLFSLIFIALSLSGITQIMDNIEVKKVTFLNKVYVVGSFTAPLTNYVSSSGGTITPSDSYLSAIQKLNYRDSVVNSIKQDKFTSQTANTFFAAPVNSSGIPSTSFRMIAKEDLYAINNVDSLTGVADWHHASHTKNGVQSLLMLGTDANGTGRSEYYGIQNIGFFNSGNTGNHFTWYLPYNHPAIFYDFKYSGTWMGKYRLVTTSNLNDPPNSPIQFLNGQGNYATAITPTVFTDSLGNRFNNAQFTGIIKVNTDTVATKADARASGGTNYFTAISGGIQYSGGNITLSGADPYLKGDGSNPSLWLSQTNGSFLNYSTGNFAHYGSLAQINISGTERLSVNAVGAKVTGAITYTTISEPASPAAGSVIEYWDGTNKKWKKSDGSTGIIY